MKKITTTLGLLTFLLCYSHAQTTIHFNYDGSGNRTRRYIMLQSTRGANAHEQEPKIFTDKLGELEYTIFPNPTKGELQIEIKNLQEETTIELLVYDMNGKLLTRQPVTTSLTTVDLSSYKQGMYLLHVVEGGNIHKWKIAKE
jgi:hypothetical protein